MLELLLIVEDAFEFDHGTVIMPVPELPEREFRPFSGAVTVESPDKHTFQVEASFQLGHFRPGGYRMVVSLLGVAKQRVPIGSRVLASKDIHAKLQGRDA